MQLDPSSFSARSGSQPPSGPVPGGRYSNKVSGIRRQAREIINAVLSDPSPGQARARDLLREHLAAHPGNPERALAEHLMALRSLIEAPDPLPPAAGSDGRRPVDMPLAAAAEATSRIRSVLNGRLLLAAFQPISDLSTGAVMGVEAFTRFVGDGNDTAGWFTEAAEVKLGSELEFAALECALSAARQLPAHLYVALKLSPETCLDPLLRELLQASALSPDRIVLQLTEALSADQPSALVAALLPLRRSGVRLAVGNIGSYVDSIPHIRQLGPEIVKLDRSLIAGIGTDPLRHAFGTAVTGFAGQLGATLIAEGIETEDELATVAGFGVGAGQGYFLGRPSTRPQDWAGWNFPATPLRSGTGRSGTGAASS